MATNSIGSILGPSVRVLVNGASQATKEAESIQTAIGTGRKYQSYGELGLEALSFSSSEAAHSRAETTGFNVRFTRPVVHGSQSLAAVLARFANEGYTLATQVKNGGLQEFDVQAQAQTRLTQAMDLMNTPIGELFIASGSRTNVQAWDKTNLQNPATYVLGPADDVATPQGYKGDSTKLTLITGQQTHEISFTGNELGPQRLVRAYHILANANKAVDGDALYAQKIDEVIRVFGQAKTDMRNIEARLSLAANHIANAEVKAKENEFTEKNFMQEINTTNNLEAIPVMSSLSTYMKTVHAILAKDSELTGDLIGLVSRM